MKDHSTPVSSGTSDTQHAVIVNFPLSDDSLGNFEDDAIAEALSAKIIHVLSNTSVGEWDGHEFAGGWARFFCYGSNADVLFDRLATVLFDETLPAGSYAMKRYGPPGAREQTVSLTGGRA